MVASLQCHVLRCMVSLDFQVALDSVHCSAVAIEEVSQLDLGFIAVYIRPPPTAALSCTDRRTTTLPC